MSPGPPPWGLLSRGVAVYSCPWGWAVEDSGGGGRWPLHPGPTPTQTLGTCARLHPPRTSPSSRPRWVHGAKRRGLRIAPGHSRTLPPMAYWV